MSDDKEKLLEKLNMLNEEIIKQIQEASRDVHEASTKAEAAEVKASPELLKMVKEAAKVKESPEFLTEVKTLCAWVEADEAHKKYKKLAFLGKILEGLILALSTDIISVEDLFGRITHKNDIIYNSGGRYKTNKSRKQKRNKKVRKSKKSRKMHKGRIFYKKSKRKGR